MQHLILTFVRFLWLNVWGQKIFLPFSLTFTIRWKPTYPQAQQFAFVFFRLYFFSLSFSLSVWSFLGRLRHKKWGRERCVFKFTGEGEKKSCFKNLVSSSDALLGCQSVKEKRLEIKKSLLDISQHSIDAFIKIIDGNCFCFLFKENINIKIGIFLLTAFCRK